MYSNPIQVLFSLFATVVSIYTFLCFLRIIISWIPGLLYSSFGNFLCKLCDPYMNLFSRLPLRIGGLDFSPMISIGLLSLLSSTLENTARTGTLYIGGILASFVGLIWSIIHSLLVILLLAVIIRYFILLFARQKYSPFWNSFDSFVTPLIDKITRPFIPKRKFISVKTKFLIAIIELILIIVIGQIAVYWLSFLFSNLPI